MTLPMLAYTYKYTSIGASGKKVTTSSAATAEAVDTLSQPGLTATVCLSKECELECLTE